MCTMTNDRHRKSLSQIESKCLSVFIPLAFSFPYCGSLDFENHDEATREYQGPTVFAKKKSCKVLKKFSTSTFFVIWINLIEWRTNEVVPA